MFRAEALAKINRELRVGPRRDDGYHEIRTRLTSIDLADAIEVEPAAEISLQTDWSGGDPGENLVVRAARALAARFGVSRGATIRLAKRIPVGAGLGGGSADAAVTLLLLARLWELSVDEASLLSVGAEIGSDVPYFFFGGEADASGRGEKIWPLPDLPTRELLILVPPFGLSTAEVYRALDARGPLDTLPMELEVSRSERFFGPNDLALRVLASDTRMENYLRSAAAAGTESAITGSGSAIVIEGFSSGAPERLAQSHPEAKVFRCRTVGREDYRHRTNPPGGPAWR